ncbi:hypothetical protein QTP88_003519 [Uroleucon formosanum]
MRVENKEDAPALENKLSLIAVAELVERLKKHPTHVIVVCHLWISSLRRHVVRTSAYLSTIIRHLTVSWKLFTDEEPQE